MKNIKGIIFDLDGTLLDTLADLAASANYVMNHYDFPTHQIESYKYKIGNGIRKLMLRSLPEDQQHLTDDAVAMQLEYYNAHCTDLTEPYPGIIDLLQTLKAKNYKIGILTNKNDTLTQRIVPHYFDMNLFDVVRGFCQGTPLKPDPTSALAIVDQWNLTPDQVAFVGDSAPDMQTATNANLTAIGVTWGFRTKEELIQNGADITIDTANQLIDLLKT